MPSPVGELLCACVTGHGQHPEQHLENISALMKVFEADLTLSCSQEVGFLSCTSLFSGTSNDLANYAATQSLRLEKTSKIESNHQSPPYQLDQSTNVTSSYFLNTSRDIS